MERYRQQKRRSPKPQGQVAVARLPDLSGFQLSKGLEDHARNRNKARNQALAKSNAILSAAFWVATSRTSKGVGELLLLHEKRVHTKIKMEIILKKVFIKCLILWVQDTILIYFCVVFNVDFRKK